MYKNRRGDKRFSTSIIGLFLVACNQPAHQFDAYFEQAATIPSDKRIVITAIRADRTECRLSGNAQFIPATERVEISFFKMSCAGDPQSFDALAIDRGNSVIGVQAQCAAGKQNESALKPYVCLTGRIERNQSFTVLIRR